jgi:hypothetical protein
MKINEILGGNTSYDFSLSEAAIRANSMHDAMLEAVKIISRDCSKWLKESNCNIFYRGIGVDKFRSDYSSFKKSSIVKLSSGVPKSPEDDFLIKMSVPQNRKPVDSPNWLHSVMDENLVKNTGIPFRSRSIFVLKDIRIAENYGTPYMVFPIGNFNYAWSKLLDDPTYIFYLSEMESGFGSVLYNDTGIYDIIRKYWRNYVEKMDAAGKLSLTDYHPSIDSYLKNVSGRSGTIDIKRGSESSLYVRIIKDFIKNTNLWMFNKDLATTATSEYSSHEVMVSTKYCYAINHRSVYDIDQFKQLLKDEIKKGNLS